MQLIPPPKRLHKSRNRILFGVCGGLAEYIDMDPTWFRVIWALATVLTAFCGAIIYLILIPIMPKAPDVESTPESLPPQH